MAALSALSGGREGVVGGRGRDDDEADVGGIEPRGRQRLLRRRGAERAGRLVRLGDMTETDAGAFDDPFVTGIDALRKLVVRHARARQRRAGALQDRAARHAALSRRKLARPSVTWRVISFSISSAHSWTALATPFASAVPWLLRPTPLRQRHDRKTAVTGK